MTGLQSGNIIGKDPPRTNINAKVHIKYCMTLKRQSQGEGHISLKVIKVYYAHLVKYCVLTTTIKIKLERKG